MSNAWNDSNQLRGLLARFEYMFPLSGEKRPYAFYRGWAPQFAFLCEQVDAILSVDKRGFYWTRIREKFGAPSFAYRMHGQARFAINSHRPLSVSRVGCAPRESFDPAAVSVQELVLQTEVLLRNACIVCGGRSEITNVLGPWASLCPHHQQPTYVQELHARGESLWTDSRLSF